MNISITGIISLGIICTILIFAAIIKEYKENKKYKDKEEQLIEVFDKYGYFTHIRLRGGLKSVLEKSNPVLIKRESEYKVPCKSCSNPCMLDYTLSISQDGMMKYGSTPYGKCTTIPFIKVKLEG